MEDKGMKIISQRTFPRRKFLDDYLRVIKSVSDENVSRMLRLSLMCGFRYGEIVNSYLYREEDSGEIVIRGIAEKAFKITGHKMPRRGFLGGNYLASIMSQPVFKARAIKNIFDFRMADIADLVSDDPMHPEWLGGALQSYHTNLRYMKQQVILPTAYRSSKLDSPITVRFSPGFHWYRKLFACEYCLKKGITETVDYLAWEDAKKLFVYVKTYADSDDALVRMKLDYRPSWGSAKKQEVAI